jgi:hypothetical protein
MLVPQNDILKIPKTVRESSEEVIAFGRFFLCRRKCTLLAFLKSGLYNIKRTDAAMAKAIISQFGGPDGETGAAMRYLSQRFAMPYRPVMGVLTDVGIEASNRNLPG